MMWNLSRIIIAAIVCGAALLVAGFTQVLTPLEKIEQAQAIIRSITNLTPTGVTNQKNILTRLTTLKGQLVPVPAPVDAVLSDWTLSSAMVWGICQDGIQMRTETWTRTIVTPASNGGATGSLIETRTGTRACTVDPPPSAAVTTVVFPTTIAAGESAVITVTFPSSDVHFVTLSGGSGALSISTVSGRSVGTWTVKPTVTTTYQPAARTAAGVAWVIPLVTVTVTGEPPPPPPPPPPPAGSCEKLLGNLSPGHAYYYTLAARSDCQFSYSLRTQPQIDQFKFGNYAPQVTYDAALDAAKWSWGTNDGPSAQQIRLPISLIRPTSGSSKILIVSDHYWDASWFTEFRTATGFLQGWKWLQVTGNTSAGGTNENIWFEPQMRFVGWDAGILSWFAVRGYQSVRPPTVGGLGAETGQSICGKNFGEVLGPMLNCFKATPFTWTRVWIEVQETAGDDYARLSIWMADETQNAMPILLNAEMFSNGRHSQFWYEYNTSSEGRVGGPMAAYGRNVVVLKNVADPLPLLLKPVR